VSATTKRGGNSSPKASSARATRTCCARSASLPEGAVEVAATWRYRGA
jgi:hypothetical protein